MNALLIVAHTPLASALKAAAMHVFPDLDADVHALDVQPNDTPEVTLAHMNALLPHDADALVLTDILGATPCNVAQRATSPAQHPNGSGQWRVIAGVNLPMLLRACTYRHEPLDALCQRVLAGGTQGIVAVGTSHAPQHQTPSPQSNPSNHDPAHPHHQQ